MKHYLKNNKKTLFIVGRGIEDYIIVENCETGHIYKILICHVKQYIAQGIYQLYYVSATGGDMCEVPFASYLDLDTYFK